VCTRRHQILKSKTIEPLKVLTSSGTRGTKFIPVCHFPAQEHSSFGNYRLLNFGVMAVRDIIPTSNLSKNVYTYLVIFSHFRSLLSNRKSAFVNIFWFGLDNQSTK